AEARDSGLAGEVEDAVEPGELEIVLHEVHAPDGQVAGVLLLERRVVVVGEGVPPDRFVALVEKSAEEVRADEPGRARDEVAHGWRSLRKRQDRSILAVAAWREADLGEVPRHGDPLLEPPEPRLRALAAREGERELRVAAACRERDRKAAAEARVHV